MFSTEELLDEQLNCMKIRSISVYPKRVTAHRCKGAKQFLSISSLGKFLDLKSQQSPFVTALHSCTVNICKTSSWAKAVVKTVRGKAYKELQLMRLHWHEELFWAWLGTINVKMKLNSLFWLTSPLQLFLQIPNLFKPCFSSYDSHL